jgi:arsenate reductase (glutaredoxin)
VVHGDKELVEKLGRNDPCPCGSGRRFKACCIRTRSFPRARLLLPRLMEAGMARGKATIWHNPKCSTSRKVLDAIRAAGVEPEVIEYVKTPPSRVKLVQLLKGMGMTPRALLRRKGTPYDELKLDNPKLGDDTLIAAMLEHPILIERPIVETAKGVRLCRPPEKLNEIL